MPARAAALPDAVIRLVPSPGQMIQHGAFHRPAGFIQFKFCHAPLVKGVDQFAVDVELQLRVRGVADPHRLCALVAGQPGGLPFQEAVLAHDAVHDLHVRRRTRCRPQQPAVPCGGFLRVAGVHQRQQCEGGVAHPTEAIVPVSGTTKLFRQ